MPLELGIWRIDGDGGGGGPARLDARRLDLERRLQDMLDRDIAIADDNWMVIGREVQASGGRIDLLCLNANGDLVALELKRDLTPREVVAQALDYGSWLVDLEDEGIAAIWDAYVSRHHPEKGDQSLDQAFCERFGVSAMPDELGAEHHLVLVASAFDASTERIVAYLRERYGVMINAVFFRVFHDEGREYLTRAWLVEPEDSDDGGSEGAGRSAPRGTWNGEVYFTFGAGEHRSWEEARRLGFVSAGGAPRFARRMRSLRPGERIWVNIPGGVGYVGVGEVTGEAMKVDEFQIHDDRGQRRLSPSDVQAPGMFRYADDPERAEYLAPVRWIKTVPTEQAVSETGFFGNQNVVARPRDPKWEHTVQRLRKRFGVDAPGP